MGWQETLAWPRLFVFMILVFGLLSAVQTIIQHRNPLDLTDQDALIKPEWCELPDPLIATVDGLASASERFRDESSLLRQVERLSAAVNVATVSYNDNGDVGTDPRWDIFSELHNVLQAHFPKVHEKTELEKVNTYGLLYTLQGSSKTLQPALFMAHQDVVPVADASTWTYPPFQAKYDGSWLWGRGSVDCKNNLIGLLSALEELLEQGFQNKRTIMFAFGFDEETGGQRGAAYLAGHIEKKLGKQSIAMIVDEGGMGLQRIGDVAYARPAMAEKGFVDLVLNLQMPGGHSSRPPPHTAIGIMSRLVQKLEDNPLPPNLDSRNPFRDLLKCQAQYSPENVEPWLPEELRDNKKDIANRLVESRGDEIRWSIQTSQTVVVISGGVADNAVPENVHVVVNYRVLPTNDMDSMFRGIADLLAPIAHEFGISVTGFGYSESDNTAQGLLNMTSKDELRPSPVTQTGIDKPYWRIFAGTIRQVFDGKDGVKLVVPAPDIMTGNTDTAHYWELSENIFRFSPRWEGTTEGVHTVDERIKMSTHVEGVRLYYELMRNLQIVDE